MTDHHDITLTVNGERRHVRVDARRTLVDVLRHDLRHTGTHVGCEHGICGACTVILDGSAVRSCILFAVQVDGARIETVEGLAEGDELNALQDAFSRHHALQCGFCTPGFLMLATAWMREAFEPTVDEVREVMSSNICRCTGYQSIVDAVAEVAGAAADADDGGGPAPEAET